MAAEETPTRAGPYRLEAELGRGGMGTVYYAVHETLERPAAVKLLPPEFAANPDYVTRFLREARVVASLRHENIVQVYDAGTAGGRYYIAMEYVEGRSLARYVEQKGRLPEVEAVEFMLQAARGLAAAHAKGLIHRDIKPENLLIDRGQTLRIVDFGLAMEGEAGAAEASGAYLGTPVYMAPEQADGDRADGRSDLYALGVTFYRALAGVPPFTASTVLGLLHKQKFEAPPDPRIFRPELAQNLRNLLLHLLAKNREDRPATADALVAMLEEMKQGRRIASPAEFRALAPASQRLGAVVAALATPVSHPPPAPREPTPLESRLGVTLVGAVLILLCGAALALAAWVYWPPPESQARTPPAPPRDPDPAPGPIVPPENRLAANAPPAPPANLEPLAAPSPENLRRGELLLDEGGQLEARGELVAAIGVYREALGLAAGEAPRARVRARLHAALCAEALRLERRGEAEAALARAQEARAFGDVTELLRRLQSGLQLDAVQSAAQQAARERRWLAAAEQYETAAKLAAHPELRAQLLEQAKECRVKEYVSQAETAAHKEEWAVAATAYMQALALKEEPAIQAQYQSVLHRINAEKEYRSNLQAGDAAYHAGRYVEARTAYLAAARLFPQRAEVPEKLKLLETRLALAQGDAASGREDWPAAKREFQKASEAAPPELREEAAQRLKDVEQAITLTEKQVAQAGEYVRTGRADEALARLTAAVHAIPKHPPLTHLRQGLALIQQAERYYANLEAILKNAQAAAQQAKEADAEDPLPAAVLAAVEPGQKAVEELRAGGRARFVSQQYGELRGAPPEGKALARAWAEQLAGWRNECSQKSKDALAFAGVRVGPIKIGKGGDTEKGERLARLAAAFGNLAEEARALAR